VQVGGLPLLQQAYPALQVTLQLPPDDEIEQLVE
jgi:hypothetical protein